MTIPEANFYLKDTLSKTPTLIYFQSKYSFNGPQRVMLSTGDKILPGEWDPKKKRAITSKKNPANTDINLWLDKIATAFKTEFRNCLIDGEPPTAETIKEKMEETLNIKPASTKTRAPTFTEFIEKYIQDSIGLKAPNTIKSYNTTKNHLSRYSNLCAKQFEFTDITLEWRSGFIKYLQQMGVTRNTEGLHIKNLKTFLNEATERGLNTKAFFKSKSFSKPTEDVHKTFLTSNDINKIASLDLSSDKLKDIVRDYFVISCLTSLRYSDFTRIGPENIVDNQIHLNTLKTGQEVFIPIAPLVLSILKKYNFLMPKAPVNQVFNRYLKDICQKAQINDPVTITKTVGGAKKTIVYKKWQLVSSHTGRRSLISNCILEGINTSSIMMISGHKNLKVFQGYVRINQKQNADALEKHDFFN